MSKQTSIEQFAIALYENKFLQGNGNEIDDLLVYFKAMHKVEVVNAVDGFPIHTRHMDGEEYYNEIFGGHHE
jgi:hypothetical protein